MKYKGKLYGDFGDCVGEVETIDDKMLYKLTVGKEVYYTTSKIYGENNETKN